MTDDRSGPLSSLVSTVARPLRVVRERYAVKFALGLLAVVLLVAVVGTVTYVETTSTVEQNVQAQLQTTAELEAMSLSQWLTGLQSNVRSVSENTVLQRSDSQVELSRELESTGNRLRAKNVERIHVVDTERGRILASTEYELGTQPSLSNTDRPWARALQGGVQFPSSDVAVTGSTVFSGSDERRYVWIASPVPLEPNRTVVVVADIRSFLATQSSDTHGVTVLNADRDPILTTSGSGENTTGNYDPDTARATFRDGKTRFEETDDAATAYAQVEAVNWVVVTSAPAADAFAVRNLVGSRVLLLVVLTVIAVSVVGVALGRSTIPPLVELRRRTEQIADGDLDIDLESDRDDEIGELYRSFDRMQDSLSQYIDDIEQHNEQLQVVGRLLRHNLKNDATVIAMQAEHVQTRTDGAAEEIETVVEKVEEMVERADKQRLITQVLSPASESSTTDLADHAETAVSTVHDRHPGADITVETPDTARVRAAARIHEAILELLDNAITHSDRDAPDVTLSVTATESTVTLRVADDGPPLPENDRRVLFEQEDPTDLNHASGIGLWLVYWTVRSSGGTFSHEYREPRGNCFVIELDAAGDAHSKNARS